MATITNSNTSDTYTVQPGKRMTFAIEGTWDGATVAVQYSIDGTNFIGISGASFTADGGVEFVAPASNIKIAGSSTTANTTLDYALSEIRLA